MEIKILLHSMISGYDVLMDIGIEWGCIFYQLIPTGA